MTFNELNVYYCDALKWMELRESLWRTVEYVVAQWLVRRTWDQKVESSSPGRCTHVVFLGETLNSHRAVSHSLKVIWNEEGRRKKMWSYLVARTGCARGGVRKELLYVYLSLVSIAF